MVIDTIVVDGGFRGVHPQRSQTMKIQYKDSNDHLPLSDIPITLPSDGWWVLS